MDCTMLYLDSATTKKEACALAVRRRTISVDLSCCIGAFMIELERTGWASCHHVFLAIRSIDAKHSNMDLALREHDGKFRGGNYRILRALSSVFVTFENIKFDKSS